MCKFTLLVTRSNLGTGRAPLVRLPDVTALRVMLPSTIPLRRLVRITLNRLCLFFMVLLTWMSL